MPVGCHCQFTVSFPTRYVKSSFYLSDEKARICSFQHQKKKHLRFFFFSFFPPQIRYLGFFPHSYVTLIKLKRLGPKFQITFCYTGKVNMERGRFRTLKSCESCVTLRVSWHIVLLKMNGREFSRNRFLLIQ